MDRDAGRTVTDEQIHRRDVHSPDQQHVDHNRAGHDDAHDPGGVIDVIDVPDNTDDHHPGDDNVLQSARRGQLERAGRHDVDLGNTGGIG